MAPHKKREVALHYFKPLTGPDSLWECNKCGFKRKQTKNNGYETLFSHVLQKHKNYQEEMNRTNPAVEFEVSENAKNIYGWLEWVIMTGQPFNFVDNELNKKHTKFTPISRPSFMRYLQLLTKKVERKVEESLPQTFGLVIDGWSEGGTGTHYMAVFAAFQNKDLKPQALLMAFSPLLDETDFSAFQVEFIEFTLGVFKRTLSDVFFITVDNCTTNLKVAKLINVPIMGCVSHRFNLAVLKYLEPYSDILKKSTT